MLKIVRFAWEHRGGLAGLVIMFVGVLAGLYRASSLDEGRVKDSRKKLHEARRMPGRLLT